MDYKKYYKEVKERLSKFSDVVYYEAMSNDEILAIEEKISVTLKPLYREYLLTFGMTQDIFEKLSIYLDSFIEDFDFIKDSLKGYIPIFADIDEEEIIYLINNSDLQDDNVYQVEVDIDDNIGKLEILKPFQQIIEEAVSDVEKKHKDRCPNKDKVNIAESTISGDDFPAFVKLFETKGLKQKTKWGPKYYPENPLGDEVAKFEFFNDEIIIEKDDDDSQYRFELEEPILTDKTDSNILKTEQLLNSHGIKYEKTESKLIEND